MHSHSQYYAHCYLIEVRKIRHKGYHAEKRPVLEAIGFVYKDANKLNEEV